ncbi:MAG: DUF3298 domain-containing protein [Ferruginibacter sp.]
MQVNKVIKNSVAFFLIVFSISITNAQSTDSWYKVFTGKIGNYTATLHLHKSPKNYNGYLWFLQNQRPMQLYYTEPLKQTDSIIISANNGAMSIILTGVLKEDSFNGISELSKDNGTPKQDVFELHPGSEKIFTPFSYYHTTGFSKLPPALKNESTCDFTASAIWPVNNGSTDQAYKKGIRQMLGIKSPVVETGKWLTDDKNRYIAEWKKENGKLSPKEASEMGLSLSAEEENRVLVMYENEKNITLANYNFSYSGGAHGNYATTLSTYNKRTGKKLILTDVVNAAGIKQLPKILDQVARLQYGIKNNKPLDQNEFLVNKIGPSENFYITGNSIGFIYATYAIKPYVDGEINLLVPFTALKSYLQPGIDSK